METKIAPSEIGPSLEIRRNESRINKNPVVTASVFALFNLVLLATPGTAAAQPGFIENCLTRLGVRAEFVRGDGTVIGTASGRKYLVEALGRPSILITNSAGVGVNQEKNSSGGNDSYIQARGSSDAKRDGKDAIQFNVQSLASGETSVAMVVCGQQFTEYRTIIPGPNVTVTPGVGPTFAPEMVGTPIAKTPPAPDTAATTPTVALPTLTPQPDKSASPTTIVVPATVAPRVGPTFSPTPPPDKAIASPTFTPGGENTPTPLPGSVITSTGVLGSIGFVLDIPAKGVNKVLGLNTEFPVRTGIDIAGWLALVSLIINRPASIRERVGNTIAFPFREYGYKRGPFREYQEQLADGTIAADALPPERTYPGIFGVQTI